jgi:type IV pilus assembly protein PilC
MKFIYQARNKEGSVKQGVVVAVNQSKAEQLLGENGFIIISIQAQEENFLSKINPFGKSVGYKDLVMFSRQLSTLISARVPILQALRVMESQMDNEYFISIVRDLIAAVENGESFSLALAKHPEVFGNLYINLVRAGEAAGSVAEALNYLADQLEKDYDLRSKVRTALTYPAFIMSALVAVAFLMFKFVLPKLTEVLEQQGGELPAITKAIIALTGFFDVYWWLVLIVIVGFVVSAYFYIRTETGRYQWDRLKINMPIIGRIFKDIYLARFARNLATLVSGGIPIIQTIKIMSEVVGNVIYRDILVMTSKDVANGSSISDSLQQHDEFPPLVTQMVKIGEQSGQLGGIMKKLAEFYEKEVDNSVQVLSTLLEPVIMVILGIGVGLLVAGILLPIYNLASTVG